MARVSTLMQITSIDQDNNLFRITDVFSQDLVDKILATDWINLSWERQPGQESWARRSIPDSTLPWNDQYTQEIQALWPQIEEAYGAPMYHYMGTAWWLDEPGFTCSMHTDGELPGSIQLTWFGAENSGTTFYWDNNTATVRYQNPMIPNSGYMMKNLADATGYRRLLWHAMLNPVPANTFRLNSYIWIQPK